jgi:hypothetical protein
MFLYIFFIHYIDCNFFKYVYQYIESTFYENKFICKFFFFKNYNLKYKKLNNGFNNYKWYVLMQPHPRVSWKEDNIN